MRDMSKSQAVRSTELSVYEATIIAAGMFTTAGEIDTAYIAEWNFKLDSI
jgi:hypothetical protein